MLPASVGCPGIRPGLGRLGCIAMDALLKHRLECCVPEWRLTRRATQPGHLKHPGALSRCNHVPAITGPWGPVVSWMTTSSFPFLPSLSLSCIACKVPGGSGALHTGGCSTIAPGQRQYVLWGPQHSSYRNLQQRNFRIFPPVMMGRRAAKIATRKGAQDAKRAKQYGKLGKQIVSAVKQGGSTNPATNTMLASALAFAKQIGAPKDLIDRNIKKASEKGQADYSEIVYEVYGLGGVGIVVEALSDNNARAAATVRDVVKKAGAKMADSGSVLFNFKRCAVVAVPADTVDADDLMLAAMDAGANDVLEPAPDDEAHQGSPSVFKVVASSETYTSVRAALEEASIQINNDLSGLELIPVALVEADEEARDLNLELMEKLLDLDDVDAVFSNQKD